MRDLLAIWAIIPSRHVYLHRHPKLVLRQAQNGELAESMLTFTPATFTDLLKKIPGIGKLF